MFKAWPLNKVQTSWSCLQVPSWASGSQSHGRPSPTWSNPLGIASILEDGKLSGVIGASSWVVWIHEKFQLDPLILVRIRTINLVHLLHLGNKRNGGGGGSRAQKEAKRRWIWKTYSWPLSGLKHFNRSVITVLYVERKIAIHGYLFLTISRIGSCMSNRDVTWFKYLNHCLVFQNRDVTWFKYLNHWVLFC
jgi:hypothetical protein